MVDHIVAGYWDLDLETRDLVLCPRSREMFGVEQSSPKTLGQQDWRARIHPEDMPVIEEELAAAYRENEIYSARFRVVRPDGSQCQILGIGRTPAKEAARFVGVNFDLAATATTAILESRRPRGGRAWLASLLAAGSRPANENETADRRGLSRPGEKSRWRTARLAEDPGREMLLGRALATLQRRKLRHRFFNPAMFGEPAFDLLLALYVSSAAPAILSLATLSSAVGVSQGAAGRWLTMLIDEGLVLGIAGEAEPGALHAALTDKGRATLDEYFAAIDKTP